MFPILNKYVANEIKNSKYCPENFLKEQSQNEMAKSYVNKKNHAKKIEGSSANEVKIKLN